jgi:monofunctional biosynthetic peptidoglycan transglycosylase
LALPRTLVPLLEGLALDGTLGGRIHLSGTPADLAALMLDVDLEVGCRVTGDAPLADPRTLAQTLTRHVVDAHGAPRAFVLGSDNPSWRPLASLPAPLQRAFLIAEDSRFFRHHGFDGEMIRRALAADLGAGQLQRGASTISQQVVKNLFLSGERTVARKLEEAVLTWRAEEVVDKRRLFELYLNLVELGPGTYGVAEGAERYFGKEPEELSADEAAQLAALLPAPRRGMDAAWERRYQALKARLPSARVDLSPPPVRLSRR